MSLTNKYWIAIACKVAFISTSFGASIFINRGLGVQLKGEYAYIVNLVSVFQLLASVGLGQSYATLKNKDGESVCPLFVFLSIIHGSIVLLLGSIACVIFNIESKIIVVILASISVAWANITIIAVIENSVKRNILSAVINIVYVLFLAILYCTENLTLNIALYIYGIKELINVILIIYLYKMPIFTSKLSLQSLKNVYSIGIMTMLATILISLNYSIDVIMLKYMSNSYNVGIYSVAVTFANMFLMIPDAFKEILLGDAARHDCRSRTVLSAIKVSSIIAVIILIIFLLLGKISIRILYGYEYTASFYTTLILFLGSFPLIFFKILHPIYIANCQQKRIIFFLACSVWINIICNLMLINRYNYIGTALASVISHIVCGALFFFDYLKMQKLECFE